MSRTKKARRHHEHEPAPRIRELMNRGWCRRDADHLAVLELALDLATVLSDDALRTLAENAAIALAWQPVQFGAHLLLAESDEQARAWRALAHACDNESARTVMLHLAADAEGREVVTLDPDDVGSLLSEEDAHLHEGARVAEAAGRFEQAATYLRSSVRPVDDPWLADLEKLAAQGDELGTDAWARWIGSAAVRWCLASPHGMSAATRYAAGCLAHFGAAPEVIREHTLPRAMQDVLIHDALLFDGGGFDVFLSERLDPALAARVPHLDDWWSVPPSLVLLEEQTPDGRLISRDLVSGEQVELGDLPLGGQHPPGTCFLGRLVAVDESQRRYFILAPTVIPEAALPGLTAAIRDDVGPEKRLAAALDHIVAGDTEDERHAC